MGSSPKEDASSDMQSRMKVLQDRYLSGDLSGESQFAKTNTYFNQAKTEMGTGEDYLNRALSTRMMGVGQNIGESLMTSGVPKGAPQANLFAGAMAPAIAQNQTELAGMERGKSSISMTQGGTLADLLKSVMGATSQAGQNELGAIGGMKDTTLMGDIMGGLTSAFSLADIVSNPELLSMLFGGGSSTPNISGISSGSNAAINNPLPWMKK